MKMDFTGKGAAYTGAGSVAVVIFFALYFLVGGLLFGVPDFLTLWQGVTSMGGCPV